MFKSKYFKSIMSVASLAMLCVCFMPSTNAGRRHSHKSSSASAPIPQMTDEGILCYNYVGLNVDRCCKNFRDFLSSVTPGSTTQFKLSSPSIRTTLENIGRGWATHNGLSQRCTFTAKDNIDNGNYVIEVHYN